ncbi:MAG: FecR domain-containing protein, partial [Acidobacteria bacterium]|nr:FecR domain-containing protein [Acidobacteriota bacterium]
MNKIIVYSLLALTMTAGNLYAQIAAKIIGIQGRAEYKRPGNSPWLPAVNFQNLENGDSIRTLAQSRAVVLLADETQVKLNASTTLELQNVRQTSSLLVRVVQASVTQTGQSLLNLSQGQTWLRSKLKPANVRVNTPAVTAAIRGTEFDIQVAGDGETVLSMIEGSVDFSNPQGAIQVNAGEQGRARIGQAPTKIVLVRPRDAVQWILAYSGAVSAADYQYLNQAQAQLQSSLASALARRSSAPQDVSNLLTLAHVQHDLGQKKDAEETLQAALRLAPSSN